jgi:hypothetical protein
LANRFSGQDHLFDAKTNVRLSTTLAQKNLVLLRSERDQLSSPDVKSRHKPSGLNTRLLEPRI